MSKKTRNVFVDENFYCSNCFIYFRKCVRGKDEPKDGYKFIEVTIKIENIEDKKYSYNSYYWKMENSQGQELDESAIYFNEYDEALG